MSRPAKQLTRSGGISYQELIAQDVVPPPHTLTLENPLLEGPTSVPITRYNSQAYHDLEMRKLWPKVWQMACREEQITQVGDYQVSVVIFHEDLRDTLYYPISVRVQDCLGAGFT